jgi:hypothetical protein
MVAKDAGRKSAKSLRPENSKILKLKQQAIGQGYNRKQLTFIINGSSLNKRYQITLLFLVAFVISSHK